MRSVLVVTKRRDITADLVIAELARRGAPVMRFDLAEFPEYLRQTAYLGSGQVGWSGRLQAEHHGVDLAEVGAVWYRKPSQFAVHEGMTATEARWATAEARSGLGGLLAALRDVVWVNHPHRNAAAGDRPRQLAVAAECGLSIPDSVLTNDPEQARQFCLQHRKAGVVYKPLKIGPPSENGRNIALRASLVTADEITEDVRRTAHLFQARVPCAFSVRLVIVGERMFAARLDAPAGALDWRDVHDELAYSRIDIPPQVAAGMRALMDIFGLAFSSSDWIVRPDGEWVFIGDLNPNGQWAWLDPIYPDVTAALADHLTREPHAHDNRVGPAA